MLENVAEEDRVEAAGKVLPDVFETAREHLVVDASGGGRVLGVRLDADDAHLRRSARAQGRRGRASRATDVENGGGARRHPGREVVARRRVHGPVAVHVGSWIDRRGKAAPRGFRGNAAQRKLAGQRFASADRRTAKTGEEAEAAARSAPPEAATKSTASESSVGVR